jgi:hypothetical protein
MSIPDVAASVPDTLPQAKLLKIAPSRAPGKGRGVFALAPIRRGEVIDEACTLALDSAECAEIEKTKAGDHYFAHPDDQAAGLLVLGLPSLCNHSDHPNAGTSFRRDEKIGMVVVLVALRDIARGEEVTRRYACPVWFPVTD